MCRWFGLFCPVLPPLGTENILLTRPGAFALSFVASTTTGFYAVKDAFGTVVIHASATETLLAYESETCYAWPCLSATDSYNTGHFTDLQAGGVQGLQGDLDLTGLSALVQVVVSQHSITSLTVTGCIALTQISAYNCQMGLHEINALLIQTDNNGATNGVMSITGNVAPQGAGLVAKANLISKGWTVAADSLPEV